MGLSEGFQKPDGRMKSSLAIIGCFLLGCLAGYAQWLPQSLGEGRWSTAVLFLLMGLVGMSIGSNPRLKEIVRSIGFRSLLVPLSTIAGTLIATALVSPLLSRWSVAECMAVGSGMGYYSLSSLLIADLKAAELGVQSAAALGTVALMSNILRELFTFLGAPWLARTFGPLAPIHAGGATTMDSTLPAIVAASGPSWALTSILHGFLTDLSVPFLVTFFCKW